MLVVDGEGSFFVCIKIILRNICTIEFNTLEVLL